MESTCSVKCEKNLMNGLDALANKFSMTRSQAIRLCSKQGVEKYLSPSKPIQVIRVSPEIVPSVINFIKRLNQKIVDIDINLSEEEVQRIIQKEADLMTEYIFEKSLICK